jgi:hypothetical protein
MRCHPERILARHLRQNESKDLLLGWSNYEMKFGDTTLDRFHSSYAQSQADVQGGFLLAKKPPDRRGSAAQQLWNR